MNRFLKLNLQFFAAEDNNQGGENQNQNNNYQNNDGDSSDETKNTDKTIPYSRFKEVNDNYKSVKDQLDKLLKDKEKEDEESKKKQGEFESLYTDLKSKHDPLAEQFKQYQDTFKSILKTKIDAVPESMRDLVPQGNEIEQLQWIENAISKGLFKVGGNQSFGNEGNNPPANNGKANTLADALSNFYKKK